MTSADLVLWRTDEGVIGRIQGDAHVGEEVINLVAHAAYDAGQKTTVINTQIFDFPISVIADEVPVLADLRGFDLPVSGDINVSLNSSFLPAQVGFKLNTESGQLICLICIKSRFNYPPCKWKDILRRRLKRLTSMS